MIDDVYSSNESSDYICIVSIFVCMLLIINTFAVPCESSRTKMLRYSLKFLGSSGMILILSPDLACCSNIADNRHQKLGIKFRNLPILFICSFNRVILFRCLDITVRHIFRKCYMFPECFCTQWSVIQLKLCSESVIV